MESEAIHAFGIWGKPAFSFRPQIGFRWEKWENQKGSTIPADYFLQTKTPLSINIPVNGQGQAGMGKVKGGVKIPNFGNGKGGEWAMLCIYSFFRPLGTSFDARLSRQHSGQKLLFFFLLLSRLFTW